MVSVIRYLLYAVLVIACICAALYSSRSRRSKDARERGLYGATTNIFMGVMLIMLALIFMFIFSGSTVAVIIEAVFLVLGAFNIFAGIRNRGYYSRMKSDSNM
ncbi:YtpI family protein [Paenibacillus chibensis]|uniref:YtpI family protein n=1 Tax=Paenibacillus chibensis TaxID=59846 RepID=A0ABU6Q0I7_9BACL|nr:YtpI family protein [Paenibacillus chibensis]MEC0368888.1 YtpI family protein [Paenibacillus chibensis]MED5020638.1 YtpI family protein [Paenibacillus chibensis]